jgi:hypothetical protein
VLNSRRTVSCLEQNAKKAEFGYCTGSEGFLASGGFSYPICRASAEFVLATINAKRT